MRTIACCAVLVALLLPGPAAAGADPDAPAAGAVLVALLLPGPAAAGADPDAPAAGVDWQVDLRPYLWLISAEGSAQLAGVRIPVSISFGDLFERLNLAGMLETQLRWKRWLAFVDGRYASLSDGGDPGFDLQQATVEFAVGRRIWTRALGDPAEERDLRVDLFAGGRWWWTRQTLKILGLRLRGEETWIDPILGGRVGVDLGRRWRADLAADFGGFGAGSDFSWNVLGRVGYRITPRWTAELGYRALGVDFDAGSFVTDLSYRGPVLGLAYRFGGR